MIFRGCSDKFIGSLRLRRLERGSFFPIALQTSTETGIGGTEC